MKSFRLKSVLVVLFLATVFVSCDSDDDKNIDNETTKVAMVTEVKGPATGKVNEELSYEVTFAVDNGCGEFNKISDVTIGAVKGLQVEAIYKSGPCTQAIEYKKTVYKFKSATKGTFEIKFKKSETEFNVTKVIIE